MQRRYGPRWRAVFYATARARGLMPGDPRNMRARADTSHDMKIKTKKGKG